MIIHGEGGTGKSKVIQTITELFASKNVKHLLLKNTYTGVAASLIAGKTTHMIGFISCAFDAGNISTETKTKLQAFWKFYIYLIINKISMIGKEFLPRLSCSISIGKMVVDQPASPHLFSRVSIIICGDFHQFHPVTISPIQAIQYIFHMMLHMTPS